MQMETNWLNTPTLHATGNAALSPSLTATAPGQLKIIKRNGTVVPYTQDKIVAAMTKAFLAVEVVLQPPRIRNWLFLWPIR